MYEIRLGYACINTELKEIGVFTNRSASLATLKKRGISIAKERALDNIDDMIKIIIWNENHGIRFWRLTSNLFPHMENPLAIEAYTLDFAMDKLKIAGNIAKKLGHRITMHPGQFVQLGSPTQKVRDQSIKDLIMHANILKAMKLTPKDGSVLIIHGGGTFGDKNETLKRFMENFYKLPIYVQEYISLENDEFNYGIDDLLPLCEKYNIPFCLDIFHNSISDNKVDITDGLLNRVFETWKKRGIRPKIHISEQNPELRKGAHSKTLDKLPHYILRIPQKFGIDLDIMLEVKDKERSVLKMYKKYFKSRLGDNGRVYYNIKAKYLK